MISTKQSALVAKIAVIIFVVEFIVMMLLSALPFELSVIAEASLDVLLLSLFSTPLLYYGVIKPFVVSKDDAMVKVMVMKKQSDSIAVELHTAKNLLDEERRIVEKVIQKMKSQSSFDGKHLSCIDMPVEKLSGDVVFSACCPDDTQHILLGDFTGHGLTSAIGAPLASDVFHAMTLKGLPMAEIVTEINRQMYTKMPIGLFLAAIFIEVNPERNQLRVWNCGMEDVLLFRGQSLHTKIASQNVAMGVVEHPKIEVTIVDTKSGDWIYGYSDGITEMLNHKNEAFGHEGLTQAIESVLKTDATDIQALGESVLSFQGGCTPFDDVTLIELRC